MKTNNQYIQQQQLDRKFQHISNWSAISRPHTGWIKAIRTSLGMTLEQLANKLGVTRQNVQKIEKREVDLNISLKTLKEVGEAMDMQLVYALIPKDDSLQALIERRAEEIAREIVMRTNQTMVLEDQGIPYERLQDAIERRKEIILNTNPKILWD